VTEHRTKRYTKLKAVATLNSLAMAARGEVNCDQQKKQSWIVLFRWPLRGARQGRITFVQTLASFSTQARTPEVDENLLFTKRN